MTLRTVPASEHLYRPNHYRFPRRRRKFTLRLRLPASAWFHPTLGPLDRDGLDWNKAGGLSFFSPWRPGSLASNKCAMLIAWRPGPQRHTFEIAAYTNDRKGGWEFTRLLTVKADEEVHCSATATRIDAHYMLTTATESGMATHAFRRYGWSMPVGPWFGGDQPAPFTSTLQTDFQW